MRPGAGSDGADVAAEAGDRGDPHDTAGVRRADRAAAADADPDMVDRRRITGVAGEEHQVTGGEVGVGDVPAGGPLRAGEVPWGTPTWAQADIVRPEQPKPTVLAPWAKPSVWPYACRRPRSRAPRSRGTPRHCCGTAASGGDWVPAVRRARGDQARHRRQGTAATTHRGCCLAASAPAAAAWESRRGGPTGPGPAPGARPHIPVSRHVSVAAVVSVDGRARLGDGVPDDGSTGCEATCAVPPHP